MTNPPPESRPYDLALLEPFSRHYAQFISARKPDWLRFARVMGRDEKGLGTLDIVLPHHSDDLKLALTVTTQDEEISAFFDLFHTHFSLHAHGNSETGEFETSVRWLEDFMNEQFKIVVDKKQGKWAGSTAIDAQESPDLGPGVTTYTKSWKGTYDREYPATV